MAAAHPTPPRRAFHYRELAAAGAVFAERAGGELATRFAGADEAAALARLGVADLSPWPRTGFKGRDAMAWLAAQGLDIGAESNRAYRQKDGSLAAKLAPGEAVILDAVSAPGTAARLNAAWSYPKEACWPVPRQDAALWFVVSGHHAPTMFAKICGVDLRLHKFESLRIAQTSVARMNAIVIRDDLGRMPAFHLLGDSASARYLWRCLIDAAAEFDGTPVGFEAVRAALAA